MRLVRVRATADGIVLRLRADEAVRFHLRSTAGIVLRGDLPKGASDVLLPATAQLGRRMRLWPRDAAGNAGASVFIPRSWSG